MYIELMNEGTDGKSGLNYLLSFAENKALDFKEMSKQREQKATLQIVLVFALSIMLSLVATFLFQRNRKSTNALQESEKRFRTIFEQAAVGAALVDTKTGQFTRINARYCNMLGYTKEEMVSITFMKITHPDDLEEDQNNMEKLKSRTDPGIFHGETVSSQRWFYCLGKVIRFAYVGCWSEAE